MKKIYALLAAAALLLAGCSEKAAQGDDGAAAAPETPKVTVGLTYIPNIQFAPLYVAEANGYFKDAGLDVTLRHHGAQETLFGALQQGEEDVVFAGGDEMMQARSTGVDIVNWATMYQRYPVELIVKADSGIESAADLAGKKVGLPGPFGENYFGLLAMLKDYGVDADVQYIGYTQTTALEAGEVDAIIGFTNNDAVTMRNAGIEIKELPLVSGQLPLIGVGLGSMAEKIDPETYAKLLEAIDRGAQAAGEDLEKTLDITEGYVPSLAEPEQREIAKSVLEATLELYNGGTSFGAQDADTWKAMADFLLAADVLESPVEAQSAYTTSVLEAQEG